LTFGFVFRESQQVLQQLFRLSTLFDDQITEKQRVYTNNKAMYVEFKEILISMYDSRIPHTEKALDTVIKNTERFSSYLGPSQAM
jgi:hypothetical protein